MGNPAQRRVALCPHRVDHSPKADSCLPTVAPLVLWVLHRQNSDITTVKMEVATSSEMTVLIYENKESRCFTFTETSSLILSQLNPSCSEKDKVYFNVCYRIFTVFTVVPCILTLPKSFIYQLMHKRVALKEY